MGVESLALEGGRLKEKLSLEIQGLRLRISFQAARARVRARSCPSIFQAEKRTRGDVA